MTGGPLADAATFGQLRADDLARRCRVLGAQLDAGLAACRVLAAAGHQGAHHNCGACRVLVDAQVAGLWAPEAEEKNGS